MEQGHAPSSSSYPSLLAPAVPALIVSMQSPSSARHHRFQDDFGRALIAVKNSVNWDMGGQYASVRMETRNRWSMLVDSQAWWFEFEILSPKRFVVWEMLQNVNSGEMPIRDGACVVKIVHDLRQGMIQLHRRMTAIPALRVE